MNTKQVIVMRKDLNMRKGKMIAQGAHASLGIILKQMSETRQNISYDEDLMGKCRQYTLISKHLKYSEKSYMDEWIKNSFTKICVCVNSEEELELIYLKAKDAGLPTIMIEDNGLTEFRGIKTKTCVGIGPFDSEKIDKITGHLKLL